MYTSVCAKLAEEVNSVFSMPTTLAMVLEFLSNFRECILQRLKEKKPGSQATMDAMWHAMLSLQHADNPGNGAGILVRFQRVYPSAP